MGAGLCTTCAGAQYCSTHSFEGGFHGVTPRSQKKKIIELEQRINLLELSIKEKLNEK